MKDDIVFPKHLGIEVNSREEVIKAIEEGFKRDTGVRYSIEEVRQRIKERSRIARTIAKEKAKART